MPTCQDGVQNQDETDIDCGGNRTCPRCLDLKKCSSPSDCVSGVCNSNICQGMRASTGIKYESIHRLYFQYLLAETV